MDLTLRFSAHPSEEVLEAYALKRLSEEHVAKVEGHLLVCEACQLTLADLDSFIAGMKAVSPQTGTAHPTPPSPIRRIPYWQPALAAAAVLAAVFFFWDSSGSRQVPATIILSSMRGSEIASPNGPANVPLDLSIASTQLDDRSGFRIDVVTGAGDPAWSGPVTRSADGKPLVRVDKRLPAGAYWVRLFSPENQLVQEYGLKLN